MRATLLAALLIFSPASLAQQHTTSPNSPDFDPVAAKQRFYPDWQPPHVSQDQLAKFALGSAERPIRTQGPQGQQNYLSRLVCADGKTPKFKRAGSSGTSPYGYPMDLYQVECGLLFRSSVFMDLYHPGYIEQDPVPGFTLRK